MHRVRFDISLRNAIRDASTGETAQANIAVASHENKSKRRRLKIYLRTLRRKLFDLILRPFRRCRRLLFKDVYRALDALQSQIDFLGVNAHLKLDYANSKLDAIESLRQRTFQFYMKSSDLALSPARLQTGIEEATSIDRRIQEINHKLDGLTAALVEFNFQRWLPIEIDDATIAARTVDGFVLVPRSDIMLLLALHDAGPSGLEPGARAALKRVLRPGMTFVDVGAHIGLLTLAGARAVYPNGKVLAIEPTPQSFESLDRALQYNNLDRYVMAKCLAAGARKERRQFFTNSVLGHNSFFQPTHGTAKTATVIEVDVVPLDDIVPKGESVDLVKIDVEGAELEVLFGMERLILENPDIVLITKFDLSHVSRVGVTPEAWFAEFESRGFQGFAIDPQTAHISHVKANDVAAVESVNLLFARPDSRVAMRATL